MIRIGSGQSSKVHALNGEKEVNYIMDLAKHPSTLYQQINTYRIKKEAAKNKMLKIFLYNKNSLYFVFNALNKPVRLHHMRKDQEASKLHLNHTIQARKWAVLSTYEKELKYICTVEDGKTPYGKIVDCADSLQVCEFTRVKFGLNNRGNHWLVNSGSKNDAVRSVVYYGIIPQ